MSIANRQPGATLARIEPPGTVLSVRWSIGKDSLRRALTACAAAPAATPLFPAGTPSLSDSLDDASITWRITRRTADCALEDGDRSFVVLTLADTDDRVRISLSTDADAGLTHAEVFCNGRRVVAAVSKSTPRGDTTIYATTELLAMLNLPGGRYELV